jgi:hypothetical protein
MHRAAEAWHGTSPLRIGKAAHCIPKQRRGLAHHRTGEAWWRNAIGEAV